MRHFGETFIMVAVIAILGSLTLGKQADLIILKVPDYRMLSYRYGTNLVSTVIKKGVVYPLS